MKKLLAVLLALAMVFSVCACGQEETAEEPEQTGVANPITEYNSLEEINAEANVNLTVAQDPTDEKYSVIAGTDTMVPVAQYTYTVNGVEFTYRACNGNYEDISGIYLDGSPAFDNFHPGNDDSLMMIGDPEFKLARWFTQDQVQYSLCANDGGKLDQSEFERIVDNFINETGIMIDSETYDAFQGCYEDEVNMRPYMEIESLGYEGLLIKVWWGSSATETDYWEMQAQFDYEYKMAYEWGTHERITWDEDGEETTETIASELSGYFLVVEDGKLDWEGAPEEDVRNCVFVKTGELETVQ